jgi:16S rRNA (uracil1498-N3)-methyltransferase
MAAAPRLYVERALKAGATLDLDEAASNYLVRVLRLSLGSGARLFNGRDGEWLARIEAVAARQVTVRLDERLRAPAGGPGPAMTLLFAPVKKEGTDLIIEKATELGAAQIRPVLTEWTQTRTVRPDRFRKIAIEAAEQTERIDLPEILELMTLPNALAALPIGTAVVFCDEEGRAPATMAAPAQTTLQGLKGRAAALLIGPEGGFTPFERTALRSRPDTFPVSLGPRILRAETAAIAAMTLWQAVCGDWEMG